MDSVERVKAQASEYQNIEEVLEDKYYDVFDTLLLYGLVDQLKSKLKLLKEQGTDVHGVFKSYFQFFCTKQTLVFSEFMTGSPLIIPLLRG